MISVNVLPRNGVEHALISPALGFTAASIHYLEVTSGKTKNSIRRFATIGSVIDTLRNKRVAFVDPERWDDKNDAEYMRLYKESCGCTNLKALCCTESRETYHHWKVFTTSSDGCFIDFVKKPMLASIKDNDDYLYAEMEYALLAEMEGNKFKIEDLPFLKRAGFAAEREYRIIYTGDCVGDAHFMPIDLEWIRRIVLNPWLPQPVADSIMATFRELCGPHDLKVTASKLTNSQTWTRYGRKIAKHCA